MFTLVRQCAELITQSQSRSQLKVTSLSLEFHVHSISLSPLEGYSLNFGQVVGSVRQYVEAVTKHAVSRLQLKVTSFNL